MEEHLVMQGGDTFCMAFRNVVWARAVRVHSGEYKGTFTRVQLTEGERVMRRGVWRDNHNPAIGGPFAELRGCQREREGGTRGLLLSISVHKFYGIAMFILAFKN